MKRLSAFNKVIKNGDSGIIYNGLTGGVLHANAELMTAYKLAEKHQPLDTATAMAIFPDKNIRNILDQEYLLIPVDFDEHAFVEKARNLMVEQDMGTNVEFIVTYRCNFRCIYCYAGQAPPHMGEEMAHRAADYASDMAVKRRSKAMMVQFIGGEPLMNSSAIDIICSRMSALRDKHDLIMGTSLTTNGSLLSQKNLDVIRSIGPVEVQITLDGPEIIHNKRRPMVNGNSYQSIVKNLETLTSDIEELTIRINVDYENLPEIPEFLGQLRELVPDSTSLSMVPTFSHTDASAHYSEHCIQNKDMALELTKIWREALLLDFPPSWNPIPTFMSCGAVMPGSIAIDPMGDIYKCAATYGNTAFRVGTIDKGLDTTSGSIYDQFVNRDREILSSNQCRGCTAIPICMGGCSFRSMKRSGTMQTRDCRHDHHECLDDFIRLYFEWHLNRRECRPEIAEINGINMLAQKPALK